MPKASARKAGTVSALDYLSAPDKHPVAGACAVFGDEAFLKCEVLAVLRRHVLSGEDDFSVATFAGDHAQLREVLDALATVSLFSAGRRMAIVEDADSFVTQYREQLEEYVARPAKGSVLVFDVKTWPSNTRLAKALAASGLAVECRSVESWEPKFRKAKERAVKSWLVERAKTEYPIRFDTAAADAMFELLPPEPGVLVQELDKLATLAGEKRVVDAKLVRENVGGWRARTTWDMIDAAADGRAADALAQFDRLIAAGEKPHGLLPQMASSLRRFATATSLIDAAEARRQKLPLRNALSQAGVPPFKLNDAERQLRQIGRRRAAKLTRWLLAADLAVKSHNSSDDAARIELERLIVRLAPTSPK
jgi:DNA polymerase-3 subunit delta